MTSSANGSLTNKGQQAWRGVARNNRLMNPPGTQIGSAPMTGQIAAGMQEPTSRLSPGVYKTNTGHVFRPQGGTVASGLQGGPSPSWQGQGGMKADWLGQGGLPSGVASGLADQFGAGMGATGDPGFTMGADEKRQALANVAAKAVPYSGGSSGMSSQSQGLGIQENPTGDMNDPRFQRQVNNYRTPGLEGGAPQFDYGNLRGMQEPQRRQVQFAGLSGTNSANVTPRQQARLNFLKKQYGFGG